MNANATFFGLLPYFNKGNMKKLMQRLRDLKVKYWVSIFHKENFWNILLSQLYALLRHVITEYFVVYTNQVTLKQKEINGSHSSNSASKILFSWKPHLKTIEQSLIWKNMKNILTQCSYLNSMNFNLWTRWWMMALNAVLSKKYLWKHMEANVVQRI